MPKLVTITSPDVEYDPTTGQYSVTIADAEPGYAHGEQHFTGDTLDALTQKLATAQLHATAKIRELNRQLADVRENYETVRDVTDLLVGLLLIKHTANDAAPKALDAMIRRITKGLAERLPSDTSVTNT